jgi:hypothetical protein
MDKAPQFVLYSQQSERHTGLKSYQKDRIFHLKALQRTSLSTGCSPTHRTSAFVISLVLIFASVSAINILNHEMWRDELQSWLTAKNSSSLVSLFHNTRYDGHPMLWCVCLHFLSRLTDQPIIMQMFHLLIATATIYIFARFSPFTRLQKILFAFGYFPLYEYAAISRDYALGVFFFFGFCSVFPARIKNYFVPFCFLSLLTQTNVYGLIIAILCGSILIYEYFIQDYPRGPLINRKMQLVISLSIFILGIFCSILQLIPPSDSGYAVGWSLSLHVRSILNTATTLWTSYIPIPKLDYHFWNTNILTSQPLKVFLSFIVLSLSLLSLVKKPIPFFFYFLGTISILAFTHIKYFGFLRHHGHLFIIFIASLWISNNYPDREFKRRFFNNLSNLFHKNRSIFIALILSAHVMASVFACVMDWVHPFSASKEVATYIKDKGMDNLPMLGYIDFSVSAVAGHLNRGVYYPSRDEFGSFIIFDRKAYKVLSEEEILKRARELIAQRRCDLLLILTFKLKSPTDDILMLKEFDESIVEDETFVLYRMRYGKM